jgi:aminoglycoside/choline kinase family phosphotransferase
MDAPPDHENCRSFVDIAARLRAAGVHAPDVLVADLEQGYLLLEDLGDTTYLTALADPAAVDGLYADTLTALIRMQCIDTTGMPAYDDAALRRELALFPEWFLGTHLGIAPPDWLPDLEDLLVSCALAQPQVFVHRDYHARNLMVTPRDNPGVLDFQDAVRGPATYDLGPVQGSRRLSAPSAPCGRARRRPPVP